MSQLYHETEGLRYCLIDPLMTLCKDNLVHFLIYDVQLDLAERKLDEKEFKKNFLCRPEIILPHNVLEKMALARQKHMKNYNLYFDVNRGLPRDSKCAESKAIGYMPEEKILERNSSWKITLGVFLCKQCIVRPYQYYRNINIM